ncbi:MAG TPA: sugar-binding protein [Armatimonadota bacterium]|jgi:hypothetical protein
MRLGLSWVCGAAVLLGAVASTAQAYEKAIYYDAAQVQGWTGVTARDAMHDFFVGKGYTDLDSAGVKEWMDKRIQDRVPSVIIMSQDIYPSTIVELDGDTITTAATTTVRKYLDAGGKVVHLSDWPFYYVSRDGVSVTQQGGGATTVLGFAASDVGNDTPVDVTITDDGKKWGLTHPWGSQRALDATKADVVLATINNGAAAAGWVRRFALMPSSGFVRLWDEPLAELVTQDVLADIQRVAEYRMSEVTGIGTIQGVVKSQSGALVANIPVKITADFGSATVTTDDKGAFSLIAAEGSFTAAATGKLVTSSDPVTVAVKAGQTTTVTVNAKVSEPFNYHIVKAKTAITIDGTASDAEWADAQSLVLNTAAQVNGGTWTGPDFLSGTFRVKYDDTYLYVTADITDAVPRINVHTDGSIWQGDGIETYVGLDGYDPKRTAYVKTRDYQWTIGAGPEPAWKIYRPDPGDVLPPDIPDVAGNLVVKTHDASQKPGYVVEARMPWASFPDVDTTLVPPKEGSPGAITVAINDNNDETVAAAREFGMIFEKTTEAYHDPSTWVRATWGGSAPPPPSTVVKGDLSGDGKVSITDAVTALKVVAGLVTPTADQLKAGDLNGNGKVEISEVIQILKFVAGLITSL